MTDDRWEHAFPNLEVVRCFPCPFEGKRAFQHVFNAPTVVVHSSFRARGFFYALPSTVQHLIMSVSHRERVDFAVGVSIPPVYGHPFPFTNYRELPASLQRVTIHLRNLEIWETHGIETINTAFINVWKFAMPHFTLPLALGELQFTIAGSLNALHPWDRSVTNPTRVAEFYIRRLHEHVNEHVQSGVMPKYGKFGCYNAPKTLEDAQELLKRLPTYPLPINKVISRLEEEPFRLDIGERLYALSTNALHTEH